MRSTPAAALVLVQALAPRGGVLAAEPSAVRDPSAHVDPFIGTLNGGHVFPGATRPWGVVKPVFDTSGGDAQGGYVSDRSAVYGLSQLHDSGTGGSASLGNFQLLPQYCVYGEPFSNGGDGCATAQEARLVQRSYAKGAAEATPGYFRQALASGIEAETTVTDHVALHRFDFSCALQKGRANSGMSLGKGIKMHAHSVDGVPANDTTSAAPGRLARRNRKQVAFSAPLSEQAVTEGHANSKAGPTLLLDLTNDLQHTYQGKGFLNLTLAKPAALSRSRSGSGSMASIEGGGTWKPSFGTGTYEVFFCASVPGVRRAGVYTSHTVSDGLHTLVDPSNSTESGILLDLSHSYLAAHDGILPVRIAVSFVSSGRACEYARAEASTWKSASAFSAIRTAARGVWNDVLGSALTPSLHGVSRAVITNFYSSLYRTFIAPTNVTGDNPRWASTEPAYDSLYCIWDTFRVVHPLYALLVPHIQAQVVRALIDIWRHEGFMPDCRMSTNMGQVQGGSNADSLLADSYVKGIREGINWEDGLAAMIKDAEGIPEDWGVQGRGGVKARKELGYIPQDGAGDDPKGGFMVVPGRTGSRLLESAYNDFSIALVAAGLGKRDVYDDFLARSHDWANIWNPNTTSEGYSGFVQPRFTNGSFADYDVRRCSPAYRFGTCYLIRTQADAQFYEASAWQYSFYVLHDMADLVGRMGGASTFLDRLDHLWDRDYGDVGDEPGFAPNYQYHYAPGGYKRSVDRALKTNRELFNTSTSGIPGNDDSGAEGAFVVWTTLGLFPIAGTAVYLISTPLVPAWKLRSALTGRTASLRTLNFDGATTNRYVVSATLDGKPYTRNWLQHDEFFLQGGELVLTLGPKPGAFGAAPEDLPPSISTGGFRFDGNAARGY